MDEVDPPIWEMFEKEHQYERHTLISKP